MFPSAANDRPCQHLNVRHSGSLRALVVQQGFLLAHHVGDAAADRVGFAEGGSGPRDADAVHLGFATRAPLSERLAVRRVIADGVDGDGVEMRLGECGRRAQEADEKCRQSGKIAEFGLVQSVHLMLKVDAEKN